MDKFRTGENGILLRKFDECKEHLLSVINRNKNLWDTIDSFSARVHEDATREINLRDYIKTLEDELALANTRIEELEAKNEYGVET